MVKSYDPSKKHVFYTEASESTPIDLTIMRILAKHLKANVLGGRVIIQFEDKAVLAYRDVYDHWVCREHCFDVPEVNILRFAIHGAPDLMVELCDESWAADTRRMLENGTL